MSNIYQMIIDEFESRNAAHYNKFPPYYITSIGCHFFNMINQQKHILTEAGLTVNTRLHIIMVAPQGFEKSFWLKQFLENQNSIVKGTNIRTDFELRMSEAGYLGTIKFGDNNQIIETEGLCQEESNSIVGIEEFNDLMKSMGSQDYNIGLENELLTTLDSGMAVKRLAAGKLEYRTNMTLWTATQPARYNLTSGLARRFLFIFNIPTEDDMNVLREKRRAAAGVTPDEAHLFEIKKLMNARFDDITTKIQKVSFDSSFYDYLDRLHIIHYEEPLYERIALGYTLMSRDSIDREMIIGLDSNVRRMIKEEWGWRKRIKQGTEASMVWTLIEDSENMLAERCLEILMDFGMDLEEANKAIRKLEKRDLIEIKDGIINVLTKRKLEVSDIEPELDIFTE